MNGLSSTVAAATTTATTVITATPVDTAAAAACQPPARVSVPIRVRHEVLVSVTGQRYKESNNMRYSPRRFNSVQEFRAYQDAEAAREDATRFLCGSGLLAALAFAFVSWAADMQMWSYCYPRVMPGWIMAIAWVVFATLVVHALRALGGWTILARNLGGEAAKKRLPLRDANWIWEGMQNNLILEDPDC
ncbi:hypothetical protein OPT61_g7698 [Boeremia exigua]|uniref:Uncharacterized protein n=1 Tax=Boeremia exigua TaxID=749465 RepID=A0ACC2I167_9PLEO|nr:hypothetical protein OPT61_g7698 [Boeremia exigua]